MAAATFAHGFGARETVYDVGVCGGAGRPLGSEERDGG
jgi:hypothetical protein